jgi:hypothetical protein
MNYNQPVEQEIDFICHDCQQPVYKVPRGAFRLGHRCMTPEDIAAKGETYTPIVIRKVWIQVPIEVADESIYSRPPKMKSDNVENLKLIESTTNHE